MSVVTTYFLDHRLYWATMDLCIVVCDDLYRIVAQKLHNNSENISLCCDYVNSCCHDSNRWRFFFPLKAKGV